MEYAYRFIAWYKALPEPGKVAVAVATVVLFSLVARLFY